MNYYVTKISGLIEMHGFLGTIKIATNKIVLMPFYSFIILFKKNKYKNLPKRDFNIITRQLNDMGILVKAFEVDISDYNSYVSKADYPKFYIENIERRRKGRFSGKALEHYITDIFFNFQNEDIFLDVAGRTSPYIDIVTKNHVGVQTYILDFLLEKGIHGRYIGADATKTELDDGFCNKVSLHCAYEMFLGQDDMNLITELYRILKPGGMAIIVPLYMNQQAIICRSFSDVSKEKPVPDDGEILAWRVKGNTFRNYSAKTLKERVINTAIKVGFKFEIYRITNLNDVTTQLDSPMFLVLNKPK